MGVKFEASCWQVYLHRCFLLAVPVAERTLCVCVCYEGREVTAENLALQGESEEMKPRSLQACRACCTVTLMSPAD